MTNNSRIRRRSGAAITLATITLAAVLGTGVHSAAAQTPDEPTSDSSNDDAVPATDATGVSVPDDTGIVHSWALAPGDGTAASGERSSLSYELPPGGQTDDVVTLFNYSNVPLTFHVYATDAFNNDDGSFNLLAFDEAPTDVGKWVTMPIESLTVPAGKQATFPITLHVPPDARPGDHVGAVLASSAAFGTGPDNAVITLDRRTGTRLYVRVAGQLHPELAVEDVSTNYASDVNPGGGEAEVSYTIVNRGNVRLSGTQQVSISGPLGMLRTSLEPEQIPELLPGESVEVVKTLTDVPATGVMFTNVELEPQSPGGGDEVEPTKKTTSMMALPYTLLAVLLVLIMGWFARRAYVRHRDRDLSPDDSGPIHGEIVEADVVERQPT